MWFASVLDSFGIYICTCTCTICTSKGTDVVEYVCRQHCIAQALLDSTDAGQRETLEFRESVAMGYHVP